MLADQPSRVAAASAGRNAVPAIIVALWLCLAAAGYTTRAHHVPEWYPFIATALVAAVAILGWRASSKDFVLGSLRRFWRSWWIYWVVVGVGSYLTSGENHAAVFATRSSYGLSMLAMGWFIAPIGEEVLFRGVLLRWLYRRFSGHRPALWSIVISSFAFGVSHLANIFFDGSAVSAAIDAGSAVVFGLIVGFGYTRTWNLYGAIVLHVIGNILTVA